MLQTYMLFNIIEYILYYGTIFYINGLSHTCILTKNQVKKQEIQLINYLNKQQRSTVLFE